MEVVQPPVKNISMTIRYVSLKDRPTYVSTTVVIYTHFYSESKFKTAVMSILKISKHSRVAAFLMCAYI